MWYEWQFGEVGMVGFPVGFTQPLQGCFFVGCFFTQGGASLTLG